MPFNIAHRGLPHATADASVSACLDDLYVRAPYNPMRIWLVNEGTIAVDPYALGVGKRVPPSRASLGLR